MGQKKKKSKEARIKAEVKRLMEQIEGLDSKKKKIAEGLIERAAFMRISLDDMEEDLVLNGFVELFSQSETQEPYERRRPTTDAYNSMNASYQKIIRQLTDLLPKEETPPPDSDKDKDDGFDSFVNGREDV